MISLYGMRYHTSKSYVKTKTLNQDLTVHNRINTVLNTCICTCPKIFMQHIFLNHLIFRNTSGIKWYSFTSQKSQNFSFETWSNTTSILPCRLKKADDKQKVYRDFLLQVTWKIPDNWGSVPSEFIKEKDVRFSHYN